MKKISVGDGGGRVGGFVFFTRFRPFGVDLQNFFFIENLDFRNKNFAMYDIITEVPVVKISEIFFLQIDSKWSKMRKTQK